MAKGVRKRHRLRASRENRHLSIEKYLEEK